MHPPPLLLDSDTPIELVDVRTPEERAIAGIAGARLLDQAYHDELLLRVNQYTTFLISTGILRLVSYWGAVTVTVGRKGGTLPAF